MFIFSGKKPYPDGITPEILFQELNMIVLLVGILILLLLTGTWAVGLYKLDQAYKKKELTPLQFIVIKPLCTLMYFGIVYNLVAVIGTRVHHLFVS